MLCFEGLRLYFDAFGGVLLSGFPRSWKIMKNPGKKLLKSHRIVMENLLKIVSHEILLRAKKTFSFKLLVIPVAVT